jgi:signal transduction histidine kinase
MGLRHKSIRLRVLLLILVPLLSLAGVYAYATTSTVREAVSLARAGQVDEVSVTPDARLMTELAAERSLAVADLAAPTATAAAALAQQEALTDAAVRGFDGLGRSGPILSSASALDRQLARRLIAQAAGLGALRGQVSARSLGPQAVISQYSAMIYTGYQFMEQAVLTTDISPAIVTTAQQQINLFESEELALQESDVYVGALLTGGFTPALRAQFAELAGQRRLLVQVAVPQLDPTSRALYARHVTPRLTAGLMTAENTILARTPPRHAPPLALTSWSGAVSPYATALGKMLTQGTTAIVAQVRSDAAAKLRQLIWAAGLGLAAIIFSVIFSILVGRGLISQLKGLRLAALDLANDRLPSVIRRLREGEDIDVAAETPALEAGGAPAAKSADEIDQVQEAFNIVQRTAIEAAVDEANLRRGVSDVFRNLARRSQVLLHRQLRLLDGMERRASEPEELEDLFRIDHLTTRMRRHAEGLIILSGEPAGRTWRHPVPLLDVLRAAVAEVEDYTRIRVEARTRAALSGAAVADVIHLIAELAENATVFSPPNTPVKISGDIVGRGFAVEIEDRGLGITEDRLAEINQSLADPPAFDLSGSDRLGLFIAGRLAGRHDITVTLRPSVYGGTLAIVIIPTALVVDEDAYDDVAADGADGPGLSLGGRHEALVGSVTPPARLTAGEPLSIPPLPPVPVVTASARLAPAPGQDRAQLVTSPRPAAPAPPPAPFPVSAPAPFPVSAPAPFPVSAPPFETSPSIFGDGALGPGAGGGSAEPAGFGLPVRVRQASLAPQLRERAGPGGAGGESGLPSPEAARSTMAALQRGWALGRSAAGDAPPGRGGPPAGDDD